MLSKIATLVVSVAFSTLAYATPENTVYKRDVLQRTFPITITYDRSRHECYVYGVPMTSPLVFQYSPEGLVANGVSRRKSGESSEEKEQRAREAYKNVPYVIRRNGDGLSLSNARHEYQNALDANLLQAMSTYRQAKSRGQDANGLAKAGLDTEIVDMTKPIEIGEKQIRLYLRGLPVEYIKIVSTDTTSFAAGVEPEWQARERAQLVWQALHTPERSLVIVSAGAMMMFKGDDDVTAAEREIARAKAQWPRSPAKGRSETGRIPIPMMDDIVKASREGEKP
jgi:hypothetical protein